MFVSPTLLDYELLEETGFLRLTSIFPEPKRGPGAQHAQFVV